MKFNSILNSTILVIKYIDWPPWSKKESSKLSKNFKNIDRIWKHTLISIFQLLISFKSLVFMIFPIFTSKLKLTRKSMKKTMSIDLLTRKGKLKVYKAICR